MVYISNAPSVNSGCVVLLLVQAHSRVYGRPAAVRGLSVAAWSLCQSSSVKTRQWEPEKIWHAWHMECTLGWTRMRPTNMWMTPGLRVCLPAPQTGRWAVKGFTQLGVHNDGACSVVLIRIEAGNLGGLVKQIELQTSKVKHFGRTVARFTCFGVLLFCSVPKNSF